MKRYSFFNAIGTFLVTLLVMFSTAVQYANQAKERNLHKFLVLRPGDAAPFPIDVRLSAIVVAYKNGTMIADLIAPRVQVATQAFKYLKHKMEEGFTLVDNKVGRLSKVNRVEFTAIQTSDVCEPFGLDDAVPMEDINNAPDNYDPLGRAAEGIADLNELNREVRTANLIFNLDTYGANNKITISASGDKWSAFTTSTPKDVILSALDAMIMRGNIFVLGNAVWTKLRCHPQIVTAVLGNAGTGGIVTRKQVADLFEVEDLLVGQGWVNIAKKGQAASMQRVWGNDMAIIYRDLLADTQHRATFALTAQHGSKVARSYFDEELGLEGATVVKAGDIVKEIVTANDLGYLIHTAI